MSHSADWHCRSDGCRTLLAHVRDGVLRPLVPVASVDGRGVARVACPQCGRARVWLPAAGPVVTDGLVASLPDSGSAGRGTLG